MMRDYQATILENNPIAGDIYRLVLSFPERFAPPVPGQFVNVSIPDGSMILRRPFSIYDADMTRNTISIIYQVRGKGTAVLAQQNPGQVLNVLAFLGNGFSFPEKTGKILLIGGGMGVAPLLYCTKYWSGVAFDAVMGYRSINVCYLVNDFEKACASFSVTTEDGSIGEKGFVTDMLKKYLSQNRPDIIASCGPVPMLKAVKLAAEDLGIPCQISLEQHMGCGIGACLVCNCKIRSADGFVYKRVCADGPVFDSREVILE
ncbi:MAG TPA: dihydroorotate dehydrogenase electron transfer subunit [Clostridia bacterium]|nr:dihydroorotate dehydrogenase electron transfer subunit [Clostridia bacterium]